MARKKKAKPPDGLTNAEVAERYKDFCIKHGDDFGDSRWEDIWYGLVIALGRADLATYDLYMEIGFPLEMEFAGKQDDENADDE